MAVRKKATKTKAKTTGNKAKKAGRKIKPANKKTAKAAVKPRKKAAITRKGTKKMAKTTVKSTQPERADVSPEEKETPVAAAPRRAVIAVKKVKEKRGEKGKKSKASSAETSKPGVKRKISLEHPHEDYVDNVNVNLAGNKKAQVQKEIKQFSEKEYAPPASPAEASPLADIYQGEEDILSRKGEHVRDVVTTEVSQEREKKETDFTETKAKAGRSIRLYRKIAFIFVSLTVILLAATFYLSFTRVTITLIPNQERISNNMIIDIYDSENGNGQADKNSIPGAVKLVSIDDTKTYDSSGTEVIGEEAVGKVTIYNNYTKNQPLVATTRLLSPDEKLFRIKNTVNVPAGGSVEVDVYADKPGQDMALGPTRFTIPGLWAGLQDKIYAENSDPIVYKQKVKLHATQDDMDNSIRDLKKELLAKTKKEINESYKDYSRIIYDIDEDTITSKVNAKAGDYKDTFDASMKAEVTVVAFDDKKAGALAKQKFVSSLPDNKELISFDDKNIIYSLSNYNANDGVAAVNANFDGKVTLKENYEIVEKNKILGLNEGQLNAYLSGLPEIAGFKVKFFPSFIKKVPRLADRVEIIVKK